jgi:hypothetical protein
MCAIHSAFSVGVAAKTANDFFGEITCHPFFQAEREREREREGRREREREGEKERKRGREGERERGREGESD